MPRLLSTIFSRSMLAATAMIAALSGESALAGTAEAGPSETGATTATAHDFQFKSIDGDDLPLETYRGKVLVVVNTASECGFTYQYKGLQALWDQYRDKGVVVLGVPSNDFGGQEPGTAGEIKEFCETVFGVDFPLTAKVSVSGKTAHPFYAWAKGAVGQKAVPQWNFHKIVVGQDGRIVDAFPSSVEPLDGRMTGLIDGLLPQSAAKP